MLETLLIVEDDMGLQKQLKWALKSSFQLLFADNREQAYQIFVEHSPGIVLHDLGLPPDANGIEEGMVSVNAMLNYNSRVKIIVMTGKGEHENAVELIRIGAYDFFNKPVKLEVLQLVIERAAYLNRLEAEAKVQPLIDSQDDMILPGIVGKSEKMRSVANLINKVAKTSATVCIQGESGTGKELIAQAIHNLSNRSSEPFITINCAAIPEHLLESELFGYEKGAFTGAGNRKIGKIEAAANGTLFLDEIGDMAYELQAKILRVIQEKTIQRLGSNSDIVLDVRVISATHQDLQGLIKQKLFRADLFYRINEIGVSIPSLAERKSDIPLIAKYLLQQYSHSQGRGGIRFSGEALQAIKACHWEGNVRQLSGVINKAVILSENSTITIDDLGLSDSVADPESGTGEPGMTLKDAKKLLEKDLVVRALEKQGATVQHAANALGISRQRIYEIIRMNNLEY
ncbi:MAG: PEP-CTERM-box response regulator transcription factor [Gammaproteobacteria bacterium]|nr:PEP-CTERM-box response regulator transcription factor [Gammaproteobacteria bacterium]